MSYKLLLTTLPLAGSALYLTYLHFSLSRKVECQTTPYLRDATLTVPDMVKDNPKEYILHHESARKSIPTASIGTSANSETLKLFSDIL